MSIQEQTKHRGRTKLVTDFVIDPAEFEAYYKLSHYVNPYLSRPLYAYRGLAVGAVQAALMDAKLMEMFYTERHSAVIEHLEREIGAFVAGTDRINQEDKEDVTCYVAELVHYLCGAILQRHPELRENPGRYDVTIKPGPHIPGTVSCLVFTVELKYNYAGYPQKKLSVEPTVGRHPMDTEPHDISLRCPYSRLSMVSLIDVSHNGRPYPEARVVPRSVRESYVEDAPVGLGGVNSRGLGEIEADNGAAPIPHAPDARRKW